MTEERAPMSSMCSNDDSFVVLERFTEERSNSDCVQPPIIQKPSTPAVPDEPPGNDSTKDSQIVSLDLLTLNMSHEEIQKRLHDLIQENLELKETLHQNNLAMKQQFSTLQTWQEEVYKVHTNHKEKFEETKNLILKLLAENKELKKAVQGNKVNGAPSGEEVSLVMAENSNLRRQIETLQERIEQLVQREKRFSQPSAKEVELDEVVKHLTRRWELAERSCRQQSIELERLTAQQTRLQADLATAQQRLQEQSTVQVFMPLPDTNDRPSVQKRVQKYQDLMHLLKESVENESQRLTSMESWLQLVEPSKPVDSSLHLEISELRKLLTEEQMQSVARKEKLATVFSSFQQLFMDFKSVVEELETLKEDELTKEVHNNAYDEVQRKGYTEKLDTLTAQLVKKEEDLALSKQQLDSLRQCIHYLQLEHKDSQDASQTTAEQKSQTLKLESLNREITIKDEEIARLSKQLMKKTEKVKDLEKDNEIIPLLRTQVSVYQADFEAERNSRTELAGEKERLLQDLRHLQRRNNQLIDDLQTYQEQQFNLAHQSLRNSQERSPSPKPYEEEIPLPKRYVCPNPECNMVFATPDPLLLHVDDCLHLT